MGEEEKELLYNNINDLLVSAKRAFILMLVLEAFSVMHLLSMSDIDILFGRNIFIPVTQAKLNTNIYYLFLPILIIGIYVYAQSYLTYALRLWVGYKNKYSDDVYCVGGVLPFAIVLMDDNEAKIKDFFISIYVKFVLWWCLPILLYLIPFLFLKRHYDIELYYMGLLPIIGTLVVLFYWKRVDNYKSLLRKNEFVLSYKKQKIYSIKYLQYVVGNFGKIFLLYMAMYFTYNFYFELVPAAKAGVANDDKWKNTLFVYITDNDLRKHAEINGYEYEGYNYNFSNMRLEGAIIENLNINNFTFANTKMNNAKIINSNIKKSDFSSADLTGVYIWASKFDDVSFESAKLDSIGIYGNTVIEKCSFYRSSISNSVIMNSKILRSDFTYSVVNETQFMNCHFDECKFFDWFSIIKDLQDIEDKKREYVGADLEKAQFVYCEMRGISFESFELMHGNESLWTVNTKNVRFVGSDLTDAVFTGAKLNNAIFISNKLNNVRFDNADIRGVKFWDEDNPNIIYEYRELQINDEIEEDYIKYKNAEQQLNGVATFKDAKMDIMLKRMIYRINPNIL